MSSVVRKMLQEPVKKKKKSFRLSGSLRGQNKVSRSKPEVTESSDVSCIWGVLWGPEHVALHKVAVATEFMQVHAGRSHHPNVAVGEASGQDEGHLLQTPGQPLRSFRLLGHLLFKVLHTETEWR